MLLICSLNLVFRFLPVWPVILPFYSLYLYSLLLLVANNAFKFVINNTIYAIDTRQSANLYLPSVSLSKCKKGANYMGIKVFNHLPRDIRKLLYDANKFKVVITKFFLKESFIQLTNTSSGLIKP
jgi:hypothetical protein